ncbi:unnamed protein product [Peniophora sp. CBMAI 1063]|nr:unnamed protein product [Peniophora sp. CBMAI 1063]
MASDANYSPTTPMRVPLNRSVSQASWSEHHNAGTSYASSSYRPTSPSPRRPAVLRRPSGRPNRSLSVGSGRAAGEMTEEEEEELEEEDGGNGGKLPDEELEDDDEEVEDEITLKQRQSLINVEHPFGLPIWKPALYKKSRSVTRYADQVLHEGPSAQAERHLLPVNIAWTVIFGWWLALVCFAVSLVLYLVPKGGKQYSTLVFGLGWYLGWPFGKYVEGTTDDDEDEDDDDDAHANENGVAHDVSSDDGTVRGASPHRGEPSRGFHGPTPSWSTPTTEATSLLAKKLNAGRVSMAPIKSYGTTTQTLLKPSTAEIWLGRAVFWLFLVCLIAPLMLIVCVICWALIVAIPMAKLNWALLKHLFTRDIRFCSPPELQFFASEENVNVTSPTQETPAAQPIPEVDEEGSETPVAPEPGSTLGVSQPRLTPGSRAPSSPSNTKVLLCIYRAAGLKFYKYTVGGVNILFVNLLPVVVLVILDGFFLMPWVEHREEHGKHVPAILAALGSQAAVFTCSLLSVIPLSYFIGMAVASISAQSSIGMGAVINATFGSIIEILLYAIALRDSKGGIVEGSIVGSILAGVLLMPGLSMLSGAMRKKEQKFNAKSAGVTSTMLIMAIIGTLTPTLFYQTYGNFMLVCTGCPTSTSPNNAPWVCQHCSYQHPDPIDDPFYKQTVIKLTYFCASILLFSYIVALWFSLRTHASQIWQNPQQLLHPPEHGRMSLYHKIVPASTHTASAPHSNLRHKPSFAGTDVSVGHTHNQSTSTSTAQGQSQGQSQSQSQGPRRMPSFAPHPALVESVGQAVHDVGLRPNESMSADDLTRAIAVATVSALRQAGNTSAERSAARHDAETAPPEGGHGGHDAPSWSRTTSASVLLGCTALYAIIAELLVDVVDVVLKGSGVQQKFLGITLFALVPNTTEFMNAMSFAMNGNIALSMEIGSAYALQVCLLQIPAMVAFSAWYAPEKMGRISDTFPLIFPRWDVLVIILSVFLLTYVYIEAKSNYHRGSILVLSYCVLVAGFYFAPKEKAFDEFDGSADTVVVGTQFVKAGVEAVKMWLAI